MTEGDPGRLGGLLSLNRFLGFIRWVVCLAAIALIIINLIPAFKNLDTSSFSGGSVFSAIKTILLTIHDSFSYSTLEYLYQVSLILFVNMLAGFVIIKSGRFSNNALGFAIFIVSIVIILNMNVSEMFETYSSDNKVFAVGFFVLCLGIAPAYVGRLLTSQLITAYILNKLLYITAFGLLLIQMLLGRKLL